MTSLDTPIPDLSLDDEVENTVPEPVEVEPADEHEERELPFCASEPEAAT